MAIETTVLFVILLALFFQINAIFKLNLAQTLADWRVILDGYLFSLVPSLFKALGNVFKEKRWELTFDKFDSEEQLEETFIEIVKKEKSIKIIFRNFSASLTSSRLHNYF